MSEGVFILVDPLKVVSALLAWMRAVVVKGMLALSRASCIHKSNLALQQLVLLLASFPQTLLVTAPLAHGARGESTSMATP